MGTNWSARIYRPRNISEAQIVQCLNLVFDNYINVFSLWESHAFISRFNAAPVGVVLEVPELFQSVWRAALDLKRQSSGAFNPFCFNEISNRGFNPSMDKRVEATNNYDGDPFPLTQSMIAKSDCPKIDLNAIAKGAAVDAMSNGLRRLGCVSFLVEIGGEFFAQGLKEDVQPWWVDIETPIPSGVLHRVALSGFSLATSGNVHKRNLKKNDANRGHILFKEGRVDVYRSVSVLHPHCMYADAWATALFASSEFAVEKADSNALAVIFQLQSGEITYSEMLKKHFLN